LLDRPIVSTALSLEGRSSLFPTNDQEHGIMTARSLRRYVLTAFWVCMLSVCRTAIGEDEPTTVYTPFGSPVEAWLMDEMSLAEINYLNQWADTTYPNATRLADATRTYNCHGYAWHIEW